MDILSPSLMCCDLFHLEDEIRRLEEAGADRLHYDIMDMSFTTCTMLMPTLLPQLKAKTRLPIDVHIMSMEPERFLPFLLPCCEGMFVSLQFEAGRSLYAALNQLKAAGAKVSLAINKGTPIRLLEEFTPMLDMVLILNGVAGIAGPRLEMDESMQRKIAEARRMLNEGGRSDADVEVDGNISFQNARIAKQNGANAYVLGTASIFEKDASVKQRCMELRRELSTIA